MNSLSIIRWCLLLLMMIKEILFHVWILPSWWLYHSQAYEFLVANCASGGSNKVDCKVFRRILHPMSAPRTLMVYELLLKLLLCFVARSMSNYWKHKFAYVNSLRFYEYLVGAMTLMSLLFWRFIVRAHEEVRNAGIPGIKPVPGATYFQKWIAPWLEVIYLLILWTTWSIDLFPV